MKKWIFLCSLVLCTESNWAAQKKLSPYLDCLFEYSKISTPASGAQAVGGQYEMGDTRLAGLPSTHGFYLYSDTSSWNCKVPSSVDYAVFRSRNPKGFVIYRRSESGIVALDFVTQVDTPAQEIRTCGKQTTALRALTSDLTNKVRLLPSFSANQSEQVEKTLSLCARLPELRKVAKQAKEGPSNAGKTKASPSESGQVAQ